MNFYNEVLDVLKSDERFFSDDGQLLRNAVYEAAMQMDAKLIKALYLPSSFGLSVTGVMIPLSLILSTNWSISSSILTW